MTEVESPPISAATQSIVVALRQQIELLGEGAKLPTVRALMREFSVGQAIIQQAVEALEAEGLVRAEVGRGTFVRKPGRQTPGQWSVVILNHVRPGRRGEVIAARLHEQLLAAKHRSIIITYSDLEHAADLVRSLPSMDACVIRPQGDLLPANILASIQSKCRAIVVEGAPMEHVDVDSVVTDWLLAIETAIRHLRARQHSRVGLVLSHRTSRYAREGARLFKTLMRMTGIEDAPIVYRSDDNTYDLSLLKNCTAVIAWGATVVGSIKQAGLSLPIVVMENPDLQDPALAGCTVIGRPADRIAAAVIERIEHRIKHPYAPFAPVYDKPKLVVSN